MGATELPGFEVHGLEVRGGRMRVFVGGAGPPVLLLHGLGGAASNWVELAPLLARRLRVVVPDLPGHGGSSPLPVVPNLAALADRAALAARALGVERAGVVGHSLGGLVALRLGVRWPGFVTGIVLAGSAGFSPSTKRAEQALIVVAVARPGGLVAPYRRLIARSRLLRWLALSWGASDVHALSDKAIDGLLAGPALHTDTLSAARALIADDVRGRLDELRHPCLVLWGARDRQTPAGDAFDYARRLGGELRLIPDCGHLLIAERADACADAILDFLASDA